MTKTQIHKQSTHKYITKDYVIRKEGSEYQLSLGQKKNLLYAAAGFSQCTKIACSFTFVVGKIASNFYIGDWLDCLQFYIGDWQDCLQFYIGDWQDCLQFFTLVIGKIACYFTLVIGKIACNFTLAVGQCPGIAQCSENFGVYCMQLQVSRDYQ